MGHQGRVSAAAAWVWLLLLLAAPLQAAGVTLSAATYALGSYVCHQQAARSFHIGAAQLPVCARCLGLYAGVAMGVVVGAGARMKNARAALIWAALPTLITWAASVVGFVHASNMVRAIAAAPLGAVVAMLVVATADGRLR